MFSLGSTGTQQMYLRVGPCWTFAAIAMFSDMGLLYTTTALKLGCPDVVEFVAMGGSAGSTTACSETTVGLLASILPALARLASRFATALLLTHRPHLDDSRVYPSWKAPSLSHLAYDALRNLQSKTLSRTPGQSIHPDARVLYEIVMASPKPDATEAYSMESKKAQGAMNDALSNALTTAAW